ncbi:MAG: hypothetical protein U9Q29_03625 [Campylobacterota bacterium]|nr:hypothetical protein [Campylobacterota bacterium]
MEISSSGNSVTITGNIKSVNDFQTIKTSLDRVARENPSITINIVDSLSMTSSVIGYFNKLVLKDGIELSLTVGNQQLMDLLSDLHLSSTFRLKKV